jgi:Arc/MetJ-type ribon-helix-helix transcriptional regulator
MASNRITVRVSRALEQRLRKQSRAKGRSPSDLVRAALEAYLEAGDHKGSAFEAANAAGLIGWVSGAPKDLSTNRAYFDDFGKNR